MKVRDIMKRNVVSCHTQTDVGTAARQMFEGHFGTLPVIDDNGKLIGIITDRDIAMAAATRQRNASHISVHEAMTHSVRSCFVDDNVTDALKQMAEGRVRRLPVIGPTGELTGILSIDDVVLRALDRPGGVSSAVFVKTFTQICEKPPVEPEVDFSETYVSG
jgi:CBS domain-containing protein